MSSNETPRYFEDCETDETFELGSHAFTEDEIVAFAERYDPQPFHVDAAAAEDTVFGGLVASGWQTAATCMRLFVEGPLDEFATLGGRGVDSLRWHRPVRPGDEVAFRAEVTEKRPSAAVPGTGEVLVRLTGSDEAGDTVVSMTLIGMVERAPSR